jgi:hypothetical protein
MLDLDTFLTALYCMVDEFCKTLPPEAPRPGEAPALSRSEVITLAVFGQWARFQSERDFYRFAEQRLKSLFPTLPHRTQFNRQQRLHQEEIVAFSLFLARQLAEPNHCYEALDCTGVETRNSKRRGLGWLPGQADIGWSTRMGWYEGVHLMVSATPSGVITGFGFAPASAQDRSLADSFFLLRQEPQAGFESVGTSPGVPYLADRGFEGKDAQRRWREERDTEVLSPPKRNSRAPWSKPLRRWLAGLRQIIETVFGKLQLTFRLRLERPHTLLGFQARLAAKIALHNFCIALNRQFGRSNLTFADLLGWL